MNPPASTEATDPGLRFILNPNPMVVMRMPGCIEEFCNPAHEKRFGRNVRVIRSVQAYETFLSESAGAARRPSRSDHCYCEKLRFILALAARDCVFEASHKALMSSNTAWQQRLGFVAAEEDRGRAWNHVYQVRSRFVHSGEFLEAELIPLDGLRVTVCNADESQLPPKRLKVTASLYEDKWIAEASFPVATRGGYGEFDNLLEEAQRRLSATTPEQVLQYMLENMKRIADLDYEPLVPFVRGLFAESSNLEALNSKIERIRTLLFDAPVIVESVFQALTSRVDKVLSLSPVLLGGSKDAAEGPPSRGTSPSLAAFQRNRLFLKIRHEELVRKYEGRYVAICEDKVVGDDADRESLLRRVSSSHRFKFPLVKHITAEAITEVPLEMSTPEIWS